MSINSLKIEKRPYFFLQWHITAQCNLSCKHCYVKDEASYKKEIENELEYRDLLKILYDFDSLVKRWKFRGGIHITGGEPLLRKEFWNLIKEAKKLGHDIRVMSNGILIDRKVAQQLKEYGVNIVQVSIDYSNPEKHDEFRGYKGAFQKTLDAVKNLKSIGISTTISMTIYKENYHDIENMIKLAKTVGADRIGFSRLVPEGNARDMKELILSPYEVYETFKKSDMLEKKYQIEVSKRDPLRAVFYRLKFPKEIIEKGYVFGGCSIGFGGLSILSDGTVYPCRRLPIKIGKVPEEKIGDIFIENEVLNEIRDYRNYEGGCSSCEYAPSCRGCRAVAYSVFGNYLKEDPQCIKSIVEGEKK